MRKIKLCIALLTILGSATQVLAEKKDKKVVKETKTTVESKTVDTTPGTFKVAYINSNRVLQESPAAQKVLQDIQKSEEELNKKIQAKREEIKKAQEAKKSETEIQMMVEKMKLELEPEAKKIQEYASTQTDQLETKLTETIKAVAAQQNYDFVLIKEAVLYGGTDITDVVIKKLI